MPKMPATDLAIKFARENPQHAYGVHLTFVRDSVERPVADPRLIPALVGEDGAFRPLPPVTADGAFRHSSR